ncbi:MAG TPA: hypothetical protein ENL34_07695 [Chloroflexi bacterium]|nr:hypothetical protein [Chloroflexota bacterium]
MILDVVLLMVMIAIIGLAAAEGLVRALMMALIFYVLSVVVGVAALSLDAAQVLGNAVITSMGGPRTPYFYQGIVAVVLLIPGFVVSVQMLHLALDETGIPVLGWGDNVLGTMTGIVLALVFAAVLCNAWGVMVRQRWNPYDTWLTMRTTYATSVLRPLLMRVLVLYQKLLFPFALSGYPVFFVPQTV